MHLESKVSLKTPGHSHDGHYTSSATIIGSNRMPTPEPPAGAPRETGRLPRGERTLAWSKHPAQDVNVLESQINPYVHPDPSANPYATSAAVVGKSGRSIQDGPAGRPTTYDEADVDVLRRAGSRPSTGVSRLTDLQWMLSDGSDTADRDRFVTSASTVGCRASEGPGGAPRPAPSPYSGQQLPEVAGVRTLHSHPVRTRTVPAEVAPNLHVSSTVELAHPDPDDPAAATQIDTTTTNAEQFSPPPPPTHPAIEAKLAAIRLQQSFNRHTPLEIGRERHLRTTYSDHHADPWAMSSRR